MNPAATLQILLQVNSNPAVRALRDFDQTMGQADAKSGKLRSKLGDIGKTAAKVGGAAGIGALIGAVKVGIGEFAEAQKVTAQTNAVLKSTGGAANVSAKKVADLSGALMKKSGMDDEAIQSGANLLLTFKDIRNEAGRGNDIFSQTTKTMTDMSVALGQDTKASAMQLGKALNDPIKGVSALGRVGVTFTEGQKKTIKSLVASGKTMDAQKIILKELNSEFGGSAEAAGKTLPGQLNILKQQFSNLAGEVVGKVIPVLTTAAKFLRDNKAVATTLGIALGGLVITLGAIKAATMAYNAATKIVTAATKVWAGVQWALNAALAANPIGLIVIGIAALVAGFILAYKKIGWFRDAVDGFFGAVKDAIGAVIGVFTSLPGDIAGAVTAGVETLKKIGGDIVGWVLGGITAVASFAGSAATFLKNAVKGGAEALIDSFKSVGGWITNRIVDGLKAATSLLSTVGGWLKEQIRAVVEGAIDGFTAIGGWVLNRIIDGIQAVANLTERIGGFIKNEVKRTIEFYLDKFQDIGGWILDKILDGFNVVKKIAAAVGDLKDKIVEWVEKKFKDGIDIPVKFKFLGIGSDESLIDLAKKAFGGGVGKNVGPTKGNLSSLQAVADTSMKWGLSGGRGRNQAFRPGDDGWHGLNRARDLSGSASAMLAYAKYLVGSGVGKFKELIHTPLGFGVKNGQIVPNSVFADVLADHYDHIHVAMASGGHVKRGGWALVGERGPELAHLPSGSTVYSNRDSREMLGSGSLGSGLVIENVNVTTNGLLEPREIAQEVGRHVAWQVATAAI